MSNSRHTFSFSNMTFGNNSNRYPNSNHPSSTHHSSRESGQANNRDIVPENNPGEIIEIIEPKTEQEIQYQNNLTNYEDQNLLYQQQTNQNEFPSYQQKRNNEASPYQEPHYQNNIIYDNQNEILLSQYQIQDAPFQFQQIQDAPLEFQQIQDDPLEFQQIQDDPLQFQQIQDAPLKFQQFQDVQIQSYAQIQNQIIDNNVHPPTQSLSDTNRKKEKFQTKSQYQKVINGLQQYNQYQEIIDEQETSES